jgi:hypothetical protein
MTVTPIAPNGDATCDFALTQSSYTSTLRIAVHTMGKPAQDYSTFLAHCDRFKIPLRGIGNEATYCAANDGARKEQIVGRVRDRAFLITITTASAGPGMKNRSGPTEEAVNLAQQVAGALF